MRRLRHLKRHLVKPESKRHLTVLALMILSFIIFDGIIMYLAPIVMQNSGIPLGTIGLILGLSSVAGMIFDIILLRLLEKASYRTAFLGMFLAAATVPLFLFGPGVITLYLAAMALWGLYYNLYDIGTLDFIGRTTVADQHTSSFGVIKVSEGLGYLIAPFVASLFLITMSATGILPKGIFAFLVVAFLLYLFLCAAKIPSKQNGQSEHKNIYGTFAEMRIWKRVGRVIFPLLLLTLTINLVDAAVWTIGPIFSESLKVPSGLSGGIFMLAYTLPPLLVGWFVGRIVLKFGKKKTALGSLLAGSALLALVGIAGGNLPVIILIFGVSFFFAIVWPTIDAAYADDVSNTPEYHEEIETIYDWFTNAGDTLGPIMGGYAAQFLGIKNSFVAMGILGILMAIILIKCTRDDLH